MTENKNARALPQYITAVIASLSPFAMGLSQVPLIIDPSRNQEIEINYMPKNIPSLIYEYILGEIIGTLIAGVVSDYFGPKRAVQLTAFPLFMSRLITAYWRTIYGFYAAVILQGFASGVSFYSVVNYSIDVADKRQRGSIAFIYFVMHIIGIICAYFIGWHVNDFILLALIPSVVPVIYLIALSFVPESPMYLCMNDDVPQAKSSLQWLRGPDYDISEEIAHIEAYTRPQPGQAGNVESTKFLSRRTATKVFTADAFYAVLFILFYRSFTNLRHQSILSSENISTFMARMDEFKLGMLLLLMLAVRKVELRTLIQVVFYISGLGLFFVEVVAYIFEDINWIWPIALICTILSFTNVLMVTLLLWRIFANIALKSRAIPVCLTMQFTWVITCQTMPDYEIPSIYVTLANIFIGFVIMKYALANLFKPHTNTKIIPLENVI